MRALVILLSIWPMVSTAGPYEDCILQNMKGVQAQAAAGAIMRACKEKTTPKMCREIVSGTGNYFDRFDAKGARQAGYSDGEFTAFLREQCLKECSDASYWSRTFGECRTD